VEDEELNVLVIKIKDVFGKPVLGKLGDIGSQGFGNRVGFLKIGKIIFDLLAKYLVGGDVGFGVGVIIFFKI